MPTDFIALYRGRTVADAELVTVSAEPRIVRLLFDEITGDGKTGSEEHSEREPLHVVRGDEEQ